MSDFIPEDKSWVRLVERNAQRDGVDIETVNAGIWATGLANHLSLFVDRGLAAKPDVVVVVLYMNDVESSPGIELPPQPRYLRFSRAATYLQRFIASRLDANLFTEHRDHYGEISPELRERWKENLKAFFPPVIGTPRNEEEDFRSQIYTFFFDWGTAWSRDAWALMEPYLLEFKRLADENDIELFFAIAPLEHQVHMAHPDTFPQETVSEIGSKLKVSVLDFLPDLRTAFQRGEHELFYDWCHERPRGQEILAESAWQFLRAKSRTIGAGHL